MAGFPYVFTFYSFKGGVGRSMALVNTAYALAGWGKHVLMVDLDLEAPGISAFLDGNHELASPEAPHPLDVLTLLGEVVTAAKAGTEARQIAENLPPLSNYIRHVATGKLDALAPKLGTLGRLDIIAADTKRDWCRRLAELGLQGMPQDRLVEISRALHFYFKAHRFPHRPSGLEEFEPTEDTPYDYILIDSRTGITEIGGLCVGPLADRLVVLCALNEQNIDGTLMFLQETGIKPAPRAKESPPWDEGDQPGEAEVSTLGPKPTIVVASPVPNGEIEFKRDRLKKLEGRIGVRPIRLSYHPQMALIEGIFVRDYKDEYLAREYLELASALTKQVSDHPGQLAARGSRLFAEAKRPTEAINLILRLAPNNPDMGQSLLLQFGNAFEPAVEDEFKTARRLHAAIASVPAFRDSALYNWGNVLSAQAKTKQGAEADRLFAEAGAKYAHALEIKPDNHEALNNWGNALSDQAKTKQGAEADRLFAEAGARYAQALEIKPDKHDALNNWGAALLEQAKTKQGQELKRYRDLARGKLTAAQALRPSAAAFNLAGLESLSGNVEEAIRWLKEYNNSGARTIREEIAKDSDFDLIRDSPAFRDFLITLQEK